MLVLAAGVALAWANLAPDSYESVWRTNFTIGLGRWRISEDLRHWVSDAAMALFFLVVGLEIKRELISGELRDPRVAALPAAAALGGMIVPAGIYLALTAGTPGANGWGIPMATDIAFALGVLSLFGRGLQPGLKLFLLTLAILDDIGAILVIALFYSGAISLGALAVAVSLLALMLLLRRFHVRAHAVYPILGIAVWIAVFESGVHATIAGVAIAMVTPAVASQPRAVSPLVRAEQALHPWTSFLVVPLFALANAGVALDLDLRSPGSFRVAAGVVAGLVLGKTLGISLGVAAATRLGIARLPAGVRWPQLVGVAAIGGIGFTVSLFVASLAFPEGVLLDAAKLGIVAGSVVSGVVGGWLVSRAGTPSQSQAGEASPT